MELKVDRKTFQEMAKQGRIFFMGYDSLLAKKTSALAVLDIVFNDLVDEFDDPWTAAHALFDRICEVFGYSYNITQIDGVHYYTIQANGSDTAFVFWYDHVKRAAYFTAVEYPIVHVRIDEPPDRHYIV